MKKNQSILALGLMLMSTPLLAKKPIRIVGSYTGFLSGSFYTPPDNCVAVFNEDGTMVLEDIGSTNVATPTTIFTGRWKCTGHNNYRFRAASAGAFRPCISDVCFQFLTLEGNVSFDATGLLKGTNITFTGWTDYTLTTILNPGTGIGQGGPFTNQLITLKRLQP